MADPNPIHDIMPRKVAMAAGLTRYFTGKPCVRGHIDERLVADKTCMECDRIRRRGNPKHAAYCRAKYHENREARIAQSKAYAAAHRDEIRRKRKIHREANKERINASIAAWAKANPEKRRAKERNRESQERGAEGSHSYAQVQALAERQKWKCANPSCRTSIRTKWHEDHVLPIVRGGSNWITNIQLLCPPCNQSKATLHPIDWAQLNGLLL